MLYIIQCYKHIPIFQAYNIFVNMENQSVQPNHNIMDQIRTLTKQNYQQLKQYFDVDDQQCIAQPFCIASQKQHYEGNTRILEEVLSYVKRIHSLLHGEHQIQNRKSNSNQYLFLRNTWQRHQQIVQSSSHIFDKIDTLNKTIGIIKFRTRETTARQNKSHSQFWNSQFDHYINQQIWKHPLFQKFSQKICLLSMKCNQMQSQIKTVKQNNFYLQHKNTELQAKLQSQKIKTKKTQKQVFEMAKKKAQLQKQMIESVLKKDRGNKQKQKGKKQKQQQKENKEINKIQSQFICLLNEDEECKDPMRQSYQFSQLNLKQKYRYAKNLTKRTTVCISPNTSIDSIKSVKFERTGKKLIIK